MTVNSKVFYLDLDIASRCMSQISVLTPITYLSQSPSWSTCVINTLQFNNVFWGYTCWNNNWVQQIVVFTAHRSYLGWKVRLLFSTSFQRFPGEFPVSRLCGAPIRLPSAPGWLRFFSALPGVFSCQPSAGPINPSSPLITFLFQIYSPNILSALSLSNDQSVLYIVPKRFQIPRGSATIKYVLSFNIILKTNIRRQNYKYQKTGLDLNRSGPCLLTVTTE